VVKRELWLWGKSAHFCIELTPDGSLAVPQGEKAWRRFCDQAPQNMLRAAEAALKSYSGSARQENEGEDRGVRR